MFERLEDRRLLCFPLTGSPFQNPVNPCDVNGDSQVGGLDGIVILNFIGVNGSGPLPAGFEPPPFVDVDGDGLVNQEDFSIVENVIATGGLDGPVVVSATIGSDSKSVIIQFSDDDLDQQTAASLINYQFTAANGDTNRNGDFFDDGDESSVTISGVNYSAAADQVTLTFASTLAADVFRLELDGTAIQDLDGNGLAGGNFSRDIDLRATPSAAVLDVNGDGSSSPFQDGILIVRFMLEQPDANLEDAALIPAGSSRSTGTEIRTFLEAEADALDANGDGTVSPFQDGILIVRFLLEQPDANLEDPALIPTGSTRTTGAAIRAYLEGLLPPAAEGEFVLAAASDPEGEFVDAFGEGSVRPHDILALIEFIRGIGGRRVDWLNDFVGGNGVLTPHDARRVVDELAVTVSSRGECFEAAVDQAIDHFFVAADGEELDRSLIAGMIDFPLPARFVIP